MQIDSNSRTQETKGAMRMIDGHDVTALGYEGLERSCVFERRAYRLHDVPKEIIEAIKAAKMDASHVHLDALLKGESYESE